MSMEVLIVDDSLTVRMDLADAFEAAGFRVVPCADLTAARRALADGNFAVAVLDVHLPDGDGVELLTELRSTPAGAAMAIVMLSTAAEVADRVRALTIGADEYVGKPYDASHVVARVRELVHSRPDPDGPAMVLVIDDSETYREHLREVLSTAGYQVMTAITGEDGLRLASDLRPSAMVVDGVLPGMDGPSVIRRIRLDAALRGTPCLLLTGSDDPGGEVGALDSGADAYVRKGEDDELVLAKLAAMLRRPAFEGLDPTISPPSPRRILAVDDSPTFLAEMAAVLRGEGYDVVLARSGEAALDLLAVQVVDCVLLDRVMPGLGGVETCRRIKSAPGVREVPLIIVTGEEDRGAMLESLSMGADDYVAKASGFGVLKARVRAQLRRKQLEDERRRIRDELARSELSAAEARAARQVAETRAELAEELERKNQELEAFSYSVSHDLQAPLRSIDGFSQALLEEYGESLDPVARGYLLRVRASANRMSELIEDLLGLSRVSRAELHRDRVSISELASVVVEELRRKQPERAVEVVIDPTLRADADRGLVQIVLENLLGNAWKFTARTPGPRIEVGADAGPDGPIVFVRDNGAGFDMAYAGKLFAPFQRLHREVEFPGTGIGLATVRRIVDRHGGRVWAEGAVGRGATVFFTLPPAR